MSSDGLGEIWPTFTRLSREIHENDKKLREMFNILLIKLAKKNVLTMDDLKDVYDSTMLKEAMKKE
jgi:hypothetical protein